jgi:hypothetical protein
MKQDRAVIKRVTAIRRVVIVVTIILLMIGEIEALAYFGHDSWYNRLGFIFQIIGFYGIGIGFVQKSFLKNFGDVANDMTSPDPILFFVGNLHFISTLAMFSTLGLDPKRSEKSSTTLGCFGQILILCIIPFLFVYFLVHLLVICPFAYIGYLISSAFVESIIGAAGDVVAISSSPTEETQKVSLKEIFASDPAAAKSFLIGIPAQLLSILLKGIAMFF